MAYTLKKTYVNYSRLSPDIKSKIKQVHSERGEVVTSSGKAYRDDVRVGSSEQLQRSRQIEQAVAQQKAINKLQGTSEAIVIEKPGRSSVVLGISEVFKTKLATAEREGAFQEPLPTTPPFRQPPKQDKSFKPENIIISPQKEGSETIDVWSGRFPIEKGMVTEVKQPKGLFASTIGKARRKLEEIEIEAIREDKGLTARLAGSGSTILYPFRSGKAVTSLVKTGLRSAAIAGTLTAINIGTAGTSIIPTLAIGVGGVYGAFKVPGIQEQFAEAKARGVVTYRELGAEATAQVLATVGGASAGAYFVGKGLPKIETRIIRYREAKFVQKVQFKPNFKPNFKDQYGIPTQKGVQLQIIQKGVKPSALGKQLPLELTKSPSAKFKADFGLARYDIPLVKQVPNIKVLNALSDSSQLKLGMFGTKTLQSGLRIDRIFGTNVILPPQTTTPTGKIGLTSKLVSSKFFSSKPIFGVGETTTIKPYKTIFKTEGVFGSTQLQPFSPSTNINRILSTSPVQADLIKLGIPSLTKQDIKLDLKQVGLQAQMPITKLSPATQQRSIFKITPIQIVMPDLKVAQAQMPKTVTRVVTIQDPMLDFPRGGIPSLTPPPSQPPVFDRPPSKPPKIPPIIKIDFPEFDMPDKRKKKKGILISRPTQYQPSLFAVSQKIYGRQPKTLTGLEVRPILRGM